MVEIEFDLDQDKTTIKGSLDKPFNNIIKNFLEKNLIEENSVYFLHNGIRMNNTENKVKDLMNEIEKKNKEMKILVIRKEK